MYKPTFLNQQTKTWASKSASPVAIVQILKLIYNTHATDHITDVTVQIHYSWKFQWIPESWDKNSKNMSISHSCWMPSQNSVSSLWPMSKSTFIFDFLISPCQYQQYSMHSLAKSRPAPLGMSPLSLICRFRNYSSQGHCLSGQMWYTVQVFSGCALTKWPPRRWFEPDVCGLDSVIQSTQNVPCCLAKWRGGHAEQDNCFTNNIGQ